MKYGLCSRGSANQGRDQAQNLLISHCSPATKRQFAIIPQNTEYPYDTGPSVYMPVLAAVLFLATIAITTRSQLNLIAHTAPCTAGI
jgi:hypothetical protein